MPISPYLRPVALANRDAAAPWAARLAAPADASARGEDATTLPVTASVLPSPTAQTSAVEALASPLQRGAAAALAAFSLATSLLAASPASAATVVAPPASAITQTVPSDCPTPPASLGQRDLRAWKEGVADRMLARAAHGRPVSAAVTRRVRADVSLLPAEVVGLLARNGTGIAVLGPHESLTDTGVVRRLDPTRDFSDVAALKARVDEALRMSDAEYATRIEAVEKALAPLQDLVFTETSDMGPFARRDELTRQLNQLRGERVGSFERRVRELTDGRVEEHQVIDLGDDEQSPLATPIAARFPVSLEALATLHGARTPQERDQIKALVRALNGDRLRAAQDELDGGRDNGADAPTDDERPFMARESRIVVPALYFVREGGNDQAAPVALSGHDASSIGVWKHALARGQYFGAGNLNTVVVAESELGKRPEGRSVLVHELGHAFEDALQQREPAAYEQYVTARDDSFRRLGEGLDGFVSEYAASNPNEMAADTFGFLYSGKKSSLDKVDAAWLTQLETAIGSGAQNGAACLRPPVGLTAPRTEAPARR